MANKSTVYISGHELHSAPYREETAFVLMNSKCPIGL